MTTMNKNKRKKEKKEKKERKNWNDDNILYRRNG